MKETEAEKRTREFWSEQLRQVANHQLQMMGARGLVLVVIGAPWMGRDGQGHTLGVAGSSQLDPSEPGAVLRELADVLDQQAGRIGALIAGEKLSPEWEPGSEN